MPHLRFSGVWHRLCVDYVTRSQPTFGQRETRQLHALLSKENTMLKRIFASVLLLAFGVAMVGCEAQAKVGDPNDTTMRNDTNTSSSYKKTTTVREPDGDVHT